MLISPAYAQSGAGAGFDIMALAPLVLIFVVFYFLLIRPQQKKMKQHRDMLSAVRRGDRLGRAQGHGRRPAGQSHERRPRPLGTHPADL